MLRHIRTGITSLHTIKSLPGFVDSITISDDLVCVETNFCVSGTTRLTELYDKDGNLVVTLSDGTAIFKDFTLENRPYLLCDLSQDIAYSTNSSTYEYIGESPNWIIEHDTTSSFDQSTQIYTIPKAGIYELKLTIFVPSNVTSYVQAYVELIKNGETSSYREFVIEYSSNAYSRNGSLSTPRMEVGDKIRIRVLPFASASTVTFRGHRFPTATTTRSFNYFSLYWRTDV